MKIDFGQKFIKFDFSQNSSQIKIFNRNAKKKNCQKFLKFNYDEKSTIFDFENRFLSKIDQNMSKLEN